jgi:hypothetical protein
MEVKCESCGQIVEVTIDNLCPNCGNRLNNTSQKKSIGRRFKDFLARFRRVQTVEEWKKEAQDAIRNKEFVVASLTELHRVEKEEAGGHDRQRTGPIPTRVMQQPSSPFAGNAAPAKSYAESSLKELMDAVRQQQKQHSLQQQQKV